LPADEVLEFRSHEIALFRQSYLQIHSAG
jgi:hypothetical protein